MDELIVKTFVTGALANNCYLVAHRQTKNAFLVDAPAPLDDVNAYVKEEGLTIRFVLLTHAHFDHISGLRQVAAPCYVHADDEPYLRDPALNGSLFFGGPVQVEGACRLYGTGEPFLFEGVPIKVIHTPGHTPGSVCLQVAEWLFSGDTLFFDSVGRTDIPRASGQQLLSSIETKLMVLAPQTIVYPGHGESTTIGREKRFNPFLGK